MRWLVALCLFFLIAVPAPVFGDDGEYTNEPEERARDVDEDLEDEEQEASVSDSKRIRQLEGENAKLWGRLDEISESQDRAEPPPEVDKTSLNIAFWSTTGVIIANGILAGAMADNTALAGSAAVSSIIPASIFGIGVGIRNISLMLGGAVLGATLMISPWVVYSMTTEEPDVVHIMMREQPQR